MAICRVYAQMPHRAVTWVPALATTCVQLSVAAHAHVPHPDEAACSMRHLRVQETRVPVCHACRPAASMRECYKDRSCAMPVLSFDRRLSRMFPW